MHERAPNPMTFQAAMQIPMNDRMGKAEAWRQLSQRDAALIDVTEHDPFKWWLFLSNLGDETEKAFGTGVTSVQIQKEEANLGLRTVHTDESVQWVILTPKGSTYQTKLARSFDSTAKEQPSSSGYATEQSVPGSSPTRGATWRKPGEES